MMISGFMSTFFYVRNDGRHLTRADEENIGKILSSNKILSEYKAALKGKNIEISGPNIEQEKSSVHPLQEALEDSVYIPL